MGPIIILMFLRVLSHTFVFSCSDIKAIEVRCRTFFYGHYASSACTVQEINFLLHFWSEFYKNFYILQYSTLHADFRHIVFCPRINHLDYLNLFLTNKSINGPTGPKQLGAQKANPWISATTQPILTKLAHGRVNMATFYLKIHATQVFFVWELLEVGDRSNTLFFGPIWAR